MKRDARTGSTLDVALRTLQVVILVLSPIILIWWG